MSRFFWDTKTIKYKPKNFNLNTGFIDSKEFTAVVFVGSTTRDRFWSGLWAYLQEHQHFCRLCWVDVEKYPEIYSLLNKVYPIDLKLKRTPECVLYYYGEPFTIYRGIKDPQVITNRFLEYKKYLDYQISRNQRVMGVDNVTKERIMNSQNPPPPRFENHQNNYNQQFSLKLH